MTISPMTTLSGLVQQSMHRTKEATIGVLSISHDGVRTHLREHISERLGSENSFFAVALPTKNKSETAIGHIFSLIS